MIEKLKKDAILAYHQLINVGLGKYSRGIVSVVSRETNTIVFKTAKSTIVTNLTDDKEELQQHISIYRAFPAVNAVYNLMLSMRLCFRRLVSIFHYWGHFMRIAF